jgi:hypothetical protein
LPAWRADLEQQWSKEARRRRDEIRSGQLKPIPAEEIYERIERLTQEVRHVRPWQQNNPWGFPLFMITTTGLEPVWNTALDDYESLINYN